MQHEHLEQHLRNLIALDETESPVLSVFLDLRSRDGLRTLRERAAESRRVLTMDERAEFDEAWRAVEQFLDRQLAESTRSVALFSRSGASPFFLPLEFEAELPTRLFVESTPVIFHLVELKDNFHRYALIICNEDSACVLEVSLGSITQELWAKRPELRNRVGREWTRRHYVNHRRDRGNRFIKEKIAVLERIVRSGGHSHIMLAGNPLIAARVRKALPRHLADILVDTIPASARDRVEDVVEATLSSFVEQEERESQENVDLLRQELLRGGLAVAGVQESRQVLSEGRADMLLLTADYTAEQMRVREHLLRLAESTGVQVEVVQQSDFLQELGGVGCLLRYKDFTSAATQATQPGKSREKSLAS